ncbi:MAG: hypothetical protein JSV84_17440 [Gemmatimonadota bacterium]|nr:MAG: hypothetical protein JSV84_17440 [Gemmatimonadota bacterium]
MRKMRLGLLFHVIATLSQGSSNPLPLPIPSPVLTVTLSRLNLDQHQDLQLFMHPKIRTISEIELWDTKKHILTSIATLAVISMRTPFMIHHPQCEAEPDFNPGS